MKTAVLILAVLVAVALSGCVTEQQFEEHDRSVKQKIEEEHRAVKKYTITNIDAGYECEKDMRHELNYTTGSMETWERRENVEEYDDHHILIVNGFGTPRYTDDVMEVCEKNVEWFPKEGERRMARDVNGTEWHAQVELNYIDYTYRLYKGEEMVHEEEQTCKPFLRAGTHDYDRLELWQLADEAYEECFNVKNRKGW